MSSARQVIPVTATVTDPTNRPPVLTTGLLDRTDAEGDGISLPTPATDPDGDPLLWSATGLPPGLSIEPATGLISGTVTYGAAPGSPYSVVVQVEDPGGLFDTDAFTWTITDTNRPPTFDGDLVDRADAEGVAVSLAAPATRSRRGHLDLVGHRPAAGLVDRPGHRPHLGDDHLRRRAGIALLGDVAGP